MSTATLASEIAALGDDAALLRLYGRCKALTLTASASLLLGEDTPTLRDEALGLAHDAAAADAAPLSSDSAFGLIQEAALGVAALGDPSTDADRALERVRLAHRALRAHLGTLLAPQYAPCGAHDHSDVTEENHG